MTCGFWTLYPWETKINGDIQQAHLFTQIFDGVLIARVSQDQPFTLKAQKNAHIFLNASEIEKKSLIATGKQDELRAQKELNTDRKIEMELSIRDHFTMTNHDIFLGNGRI